MEACSIQSRRWNVIDRAQNSTYHIESLPYYGASCFDTFACPKEPQHYHTRRWSLAMDWARGTSYLYVSMRCSWEKWTSRNLGCADIVQQAYPCRKFSQILPPLNALLVTKRLQQSWHQSIPVRAKEMSVELLGMGRKNFYVIICVEHCCVILNVRAENGRVYVEKNYFATFLWKNQKKNKILEQLTHL